MAFTQTLKGETEDETAEKPAQKPYIATLLTPKQIHFSGLCWILRAVLVLCDGAHTADDMAQELFRTFDEIANALFVLYWHNAIQMLVIDDLPTPIALDCVYRFAPLPLSVKLCGGASYVQTRHRNPADRHPASSFRPYQPRTRPGDCASGRSLFAA